MIVTWYSTRHKLGNTFYVFYHNFSQRTCLNHLHQFIGQCLFATWDSQSSVGENTCENTKKNICERNTIVHALLATKSADWDYFSEFSPSHYICLLCIYAPPTASDLPTSTKVHLWIITNLHVNQTQASTNITNTFSNSVDNFPQIQCTLVIQYSRKMCPSSCLILYLLGQVWTENIDVFIYMYFDFSLWCFYMSWYPIISYMYLLCISPS